MSKRIAIAADHGGYSLKELLKASFTEIDWVDFGTHTSDSVDYPDYAQTLCKGVLSGEAETGVLICGTGIGMSIAANRFKDIRAAVVTSATEARLTRLHNNANVLCMGERIIGIESAKDCLKVFLETEYEGRRHDRRVEKLGLVH